MPTHDSLLAQLDELLDQAQHNLSSSEYLDIKEHLRERLDLDDSDPDEGLEFTPEFANRLRRYLQERPRGIPAEEVFRELGLDE